MVNMLLQLTNVLALVFQRVNSWTKIHSFDW